MSDWDRYVIVTRADGTTSTVPLATWNQELAQRVLDAGGSYTLPEEAAVDKTRPVFVMKSIQDHDEDDGISDLEIVEGLRELLVGGDLQPKERSLLRSLETRLEYGNAFTVSQKGWAMGILSRD